ncbi:phage tail tip lysozyme [Methylocella sp. CPCC 101449]|uniref:phage tail tip lysozyme n=1 Tax=Methylocella sp. CPCC 101449 TaxID=2987531 RepID=UPI00288F6E95|nr:phage tail tip lysozyme [Methylocella sp. CPCC 101449]MDT2024548.1 phage tail tip lysozyme [Methylocella sp. CPCC 101449]
MESFGQGISNLGTGLGYMARTQNKQTEDLQGARAKADAASAQIRYEEELSKTNDPKTIERLRGDFDRSIAAAGQNISNEGQRSRFMVDYSPVMAKAKASADDRVWKIGRSTAMAADQDRLDHLSDDLQRATTDEQRQQIYQAGAAIFAGQEKAGYLDPVNARDLRKKWAEGSAVNLLKAMTPEQRLEAVRPVDVNKTGGQIVDFFKAKGWSPEQAAAIAGHLYVESTFNPGATNKGDGADGSDSIGVAQWNAGRARAFKAFAAARGKPVNDLETQLEFIDHELRTSESSAGDKLRNAKSIDEATTAFLSFERPKGWEGGLNTASNGLNRLRAAKAYYAGGGTSTKEDSKFFGSVLSEAQRQDIADRAETEILQRERQNDFNRKTEATAVKGLMADDNASILATGKPLDSLTPDRVSASYGPQAEADFREERRLATRTYAQTNDFALIPNGEIASRVATLAPTPGSDGYVRQQQYYDWAQKRAQEVIKKRQDDPADAVSSFPAVQQAAQSADWNDASTIVPLVRARLDAQRQLGISDANQSPVTVAEAKSLFAPVLNAPANMQAQELRKVAQQFDQLFGEYAPRAFASAIMSADLDKQSAELAGAMLRKIGLGQKPTRQEEQALEESQASAAAEKAASNVASNPVLPSGTPVYSPLQDQAAPAPQEPQAKQIPAGAISKLQENPALAADFMRKYGRKEYGQGTAARVIEKLGLGELLQSKPEGQMRGSGIRLPEGQ